MKESSLSQRVKYYGPNDLSLSWHIKPVCNFINEFKIDRTYNCNEILGLQNCIKYLENKRFVEMIPKNKQSLYAGKIKDIKQVIGRYWNDVGTKDEINNIVGVEYDFHEDLVASLIDYRLDKKLTNEELVKILSNNHVSLFIMLSNKELTKILNNKLRTMILDNTAEGAECIFNAKLLGGRTKNISLPASLTKSDIDGVINAYLDRVDVNFNYLRVVAQASLATGISAQTKLKAKQRYDEESKKLFTDQKDSLKYGIEIKFSANQKDPLVMNNKESLTSYSISVNYLDERLDYESIICNFASIFGMVDSDIILTLPSYPSEISTLEKVFVISGKDDYLIGTNFSMKQWRILHSIALYEQYLKPKNINIEEVVQWFFGNYLKTTFNTPSFLYRPSSSKTYYEKAKNLFTEMEGVMKQAKMYIEEGAISSDLLELTSTPFAYSDLLSLNSKKYVYINNKNANIKQIMHLVFSDQSGLGYISKERQTENLFRLLTEHEVKLKNFQEYQKPVIEYLLKNNILIKDDDDTVLFDAEILIILSKLNRIGAIVYHRCANNIKSKLDKLISKQWLVCVNTLLTDYESDYFDYCLNHKKFSNSLDLRNKYLHGSSSYAQDEDAHRMAYLQGIILLLALVIKIQDDFALSLANKSTQELTI